MALSPVSRTAIGVARVRAGESLRPDRLFEDLFAQRLVDAFPEVGSSGASPELRRALYVQVSLRTRFFDDHLLAGDPRQVVLLGAGLDTRAFRLRWPAGTRVFELDLPAVVAAKAPLMTGAAALCERHVLGVDLTLDWSASLVEQGFSTTQPTSWLAEGLLVYLSARDAEHVLNTVTCLSAPGSRLALEQGTSTQAEDDLTRLWQGGLEDSAGWLDRHGWAVVAHPLDEVAGHYGRPLSRPSTSGFLTATRDPSRS